MARRDDGLMDLLSELPWWISVIVGVVVYVVMAFVIPAVSSGNPMSKPLAQVASQFSWIALIFLLPAGFSAFRSASKSRLLDRQTSIESIQSLPWKRFEELLGEAYRRQGYSVVENSTLGSDGGIDLTIRMGGSAFLVQCKQWRTSKVGVKVIREMFGLMTAHHAAGAIVVTSGTFTKEARDFASGKPIELVEGDQLVQIIHSVQTRPVVATVPQAASATRICPACGSELVVRVARKGPHAGGKFWGCASFPKCRHTEEYVS